MHACVDDPAVSDAGMLRMLYDRRLRARARPKRVAGPICPLIVQAAALLMDRNLRRCGHAQRRTAVRGSGRMPRTTAAKRQVEGEENPGAHVQIGEENPGAHVQIGGDESTAAEAYAVYAR